MARREAASGRERWLYTLFFIWVQSIWVQNRTSPLLLLLTSFNKRAAHEVDAESEVKKKTLFSIDESCFVYAFPLLLNTTRTTVSQQA
jgi:hypothetical protein